MVLLYRGLLFPTVGDFQSMQPAVVAVLRCIFIDSSFCGKVQVLGICFFTKSIHVMKLLMLFGKFL